MLKITIIKNKNTPEMHWWHNMPLSRNINKIFTYLNISHMPDHANQNRKSQILGNFDVYLHLKNQLDPSLLLWEITLERILSSARLRAFWPITWEPKFCQTWDWWRNINNNFRLNLDYFQAKLMRNVLKKIQKTYFEGFVDTFFHNLDKNEFS